MCGICGIVSETESDHRLLDRMVEQLSHRGPDHQGTHHGTDGVSLGNARLAILDIDGGNQPIYNEDRSIVAVYNGEVFNYRELRNDLIALGHRMNSDCDSEVLVHLYEHYGHSMVERLRGQFAFVIWDSRTRKLFAARDRFGIKPLWYFHKGTQFFFASEPQAITDVFPALRTLNPLAVDAFLSFRAVPAPMSMFRDIFALPPGTLLEYEAGNVSLRTYWQYPQPAKESGDSSGILDQTESLLHEAVSLRMISDVPVGVLLSGGVDSALIVAMLSKMGFSGLPTFFLGFRHSGERFNEQSAARELADLFHTEHHEFFLDEQVIVEDLPKIIRHLPQPCGDGIQKYFVTKFASQSLKVLLSGTGGDELFAGYEWFSLLRRLKQVSRIAHMAGSVVPASVIAAFSGSRIFSPRLNKLMSFMERDDFLQRYGVVKSLMQREEKLSIYSPSFRSSLPEIDQARAMYESIDQDWANLEEVDRISQLQISLDLPSIILLNEDAMSMANSVEVRFPYLDHHLAEFVAQRPHTDKQRGDISKYLLREIAGRYLPDAVAQRPKHGFIMPLGQWLRSSLKQYLDSVFSRKSVEDRDLFSWPVMKRMYDRFLEGKEDCYRIWNITMLELWLRYHLDER